MTPPEPRGRLASTVLAGLVLIIAGCAPTSSSAGDGESLPPSSSVSGDPSQASTSSTPSATSDGDESTAPAPLPLAEALRAFVAESDDVPDTVEQYVTSASDQELEELGSQACALIEPDMSRSELGTVAYQARTSLLSDDDQALLDITDFGILFGATAGLSCPEQLPIGVEPPPEPRNQDLIDGYRETVPGYWSPDEAPSRFVAGIGDDRLHELQESACRFSAAGQTATELGTAVLAHHSAELTPDEKAAITPADYAEVYGSLIGWFCPDRLPTVD
jgi:hypothetical protein